MLLVAYRLELPYVSDGSPIMGEVVSVEGQSGAKDALVKLESGRIVRAAIPAAWALPSRLTDTELVRIRTSGIRSAWAGQICTSG